MMGCMPTDTLTDYSATIRAQIERDVARLVAELKGQLRDPECAEDWEDLTPYIELGSLVNTHHGLDLYQRGDLIMGMVVRVGDAPARTIRLCADKVAFVREEAESDEDGEATTREVDEERDLCAETRW